MEKKIEFEVICADYSCQNTHVFEIDSDYNYCDCHNTCILWNNITFYGIPFSLLDDKMTSINEGDYRDAVKIGELFGCLILCEQILEEGEEPLEICDDIDGDLEYVISALSDEDGPLSWESGDPYQDVYYIHELKMEAGYDNPLLKARIINELPGVVLSFFHVAPDILAFYPAPLKKISDPDKEARYEALQNIAAQKVSTAFSGVFGEQEKEQKQDNILKFGNAYRFSEDELKWVMGRRHSGSSYPEEVKDHEEYAFYEANGFEEVSDSRLLYKYVGRG